MNFQTSTVKGFRFNLFHCLGLYAILFCLNLSNSLAQNTLSKNLVTSPKSPNVASIEKYGNFEVNLFHGVPDIQIPIFDLNTKHFKVPINLSYHASGIKVSDKSSWVGLGWSLKAGGQVSRVIKGKDDLSGRLHTSYRLKTPEEINPSTIDGWLYLRSIESTGQDGEPDIFSYSVPGKYGNFVYKDRNTPILIPSAPVKITRDQVIDSSPNFRFNMLDEDGNNYFFGKSLIGESITEIASSQVGGSNSDHASSWLLTHMISRDKSDTISYNYFPVQTVKTFEETTESTYIKDNFQIFIPALTNEGSSVTNVPITSTHYIGQRLLKEILFDNGKIEFSTFSSERLDLNAPALEKIRIYAKSRTGFDLLKTVEFYYGYFGQNPKLKLRLDSIKMKGTDDQVEIYRFKYESVAAPQEGNPFAKDYWGYFNNKPNTTLLPLKIVPYLAGAGLTTVQIGSADRNPDPSAVQNNILRQIQFPTGGYTVFNYEPNMYYNPIKDMIGGGVRIRSIFSYTESNSEPTVKSYSYGTENAPESGVGYLNSIKSVNFPVNRTSTYYWRFIRNENGISPHPFLVSSNDDSNYTSDISYSLNDFDDSNVYYPSVTEYFGTKETNIGKKTFEFSSFSDGIRVGAGGYLPAVQSFHWKRGKLLKVKEFEKKIGQKYELKSETSNGYEEVTPRTVSNMGLSVVLQSNIVGDVFESFFLGALSPLPYYYAFFDFYTGAYLPSFSRVTKFEPSGQSQTSTLYQYNSSFQPSVIKKIQSSGDTLITRMKYADDYRLGVNPVGSSGIWNLKNLNAVSIPIENSTSIKQITGAEKLISGMIETYYDDKALLKDEYRTELLEPLVNYLPSSIDNGGQLIIPSAFKKRLTFNRYDVRGNLLEYSLDNSKKGAYIWGYRKSKVIAEVQNAGVDQIAYTSFEDEDSGGWIFGDSGVKLFAKAVTGRFVYDFSLSGSISKTGLGPQQYVISYWAQKACLVNGVAPESSGSQSIDGWRFFRHLITPTNGTLTLSSNDALIDELKLYPYAALINTYTHNPLVGVSSVSGTDSKFSSYTYDGLQRLSTIKDQSTSIRASYKYRMSNQHLLTNLPTVFYNNKMSQVFVKNSCGSLNYGSKVTYEIPEGSYFSTLSQQDAQNKAQAALLANGQEYANENGECRLKTEVTWEPIEPYCQIKAVDVSNPPTPSGYGITLQSIPNTNYTSVTISRSSSTYAVKVNFKVHFNANNSVSSSVVLGADETTKTFTISVYPYTNDMRSGGSVTSVELYNYLYMTGTSFYAKRQKRIGGEVVLTEPNLKGVGEGPYYDVRRYSGEGYTICQQGYVQVNPTYVAYANTDYNMEFSKICPSGQIGSRVTYSVPAGKYTSSVSQADADAKAKAEALANGQAYANTTGTCYSTN